VILVAKCDYNVYHDGDMPFLTVYCTVRLTTVEENQLFENIAFVCRDGVYISRKDIFKYALISKLYMSS